VAVKQKDIESHHFPQDSAEMIAQQKQIALNTKITLGSYLSGQRRLLLCGFGWRTVERFFDSLSSSSEEVVSD